MFESLSKLYWKIKVLLKVSGAQLAWEGGLLRLFLKKKRSDLILEKSSLSVCMYESDSHSKCSFKSILEKKHQIFPAGSLFCMSYTKRLSKNPCLRNLSCPENSPVARLRFKDFI